MDYSIKSVTSWLTDGSSHTADILTIVGMGGIGKTSLAKYVYGLHCREFHTSSFIDDIGRKCAAQFNGLLDLQKQLCGDISKTSSINQVHDKLAYTSMLENALARKKTFIVLDDIDSVNQLHALLGKQGFYPGSKIIITTKEVSLTRKYAPNPKVQLIHTKLLLNGLDPEASLQLLSNHAFKCNYPKDGYKEVSEKLVEYCGGHPLALEVLGESLQGREVAEWEESIQRLNEETDDRIKNVLQVSFVSMPSKNDQELFKHIACFFVGMDRDHAETILKACGFQSQLGIKNLIDRCLLSINEWNNTLTMHQLLQDMGRDVVRQESPDKPWERSRLWCHVETVKALKRKKGMENLLGLAIDTTMLEKEKLRGSFELEIDTLSNMDSLMLLQLNYVHLNGSYKNLPEELRWLCMHGFPLNSIPLDSAMENLVAIDMSYSNIESFDMSSYSSNPQPPQKRQKLIGSCSKGKRLLVSLKILDLSFCEQLHSLGGFLELPALERLIVRSCIGLIEVCESIEQCVGLVLVDLSGCNKIKKISKFLGKLNKVETLSLDGCDLGEQIQIEMRDMDPPETSKGKNIVIRSQTSSSSAIAESIPIDLKFFEISLPRSLVRLSLRDNKLSNESFPVDFSGLSMLKELILDGNPIVSMPNCVRSLPRLEMLRMSECHMLTSIEHPPCTLRELRVFLFGYINKSSGLRRIAFDPEMSPLHLELDYEDLLGGGYYSSIEIEGVVKIQAMGGVEEKVLRSLGWTKLEFLKKRRLGTYHYDRGEEGSQVQMYYEFGIFSTIYGGEAVPERISERTKGPSTSSSISFVIPSSSSNNKLRGLNFCCCVASIYDQCYKKLRLPAIKISNITKKRTWIYRHYIDSNRGKIVVGGRCLIYLSHWMFGMNEMEGGDDVTITVVRSVFTEIRECGVGFVYDDDEEGEDALDYYKSWNHIIGTGGDLNAFQLHTTTPAATTFTSTTTTRGARGGEQYLLHYYRFFNYDSDETRVWRRYKIFDDGDEPEAVGRRYKETGNAFFRAFSQKKKSTEK